VPKAAKAVGKGAMLSQPGLRDFGNWEACFRKWGADIGRDLAAGRRVSRGPLKLDRKALQAMLALPPLVSGKWED